MSFVLVLDAAVSDVIDFCGEDCPGGERDEGEVEVAELDADFNEESFEDEGESEKECAKECGDDAACAEVSWFFFNEPFAKDFGVLCDLVEFGHSSRILFGEAMWGR